MGHNIDHPQNRPVGRNAKGLIVSLITGVAILAGCTMAVHCVKKKQAQQVETTEAIDNLDRIYRASATYYTSPRVGERTGKPVPCQFPADQGMTPDVTAKKCCGGALDADKDDRCDVDTSQWTTATWSALNFQMNAQHFFGYSYESVGLLAEARFTATANADLDCDTTLSTFQRYGYGDLTASHAECSMKGSSAFYKHLPNE